MSAGHHSMMEAGDRVPYIMPDGTSYWDSGFVAAAGCEYRINAIWLGFPRTPGVDTPMLADRVYTSGAAMPCTFNYGARQRDCVTTQLSRTEAFFYDVSSFVGTVSTIVVKHKVSGNVISVGFEGASPATATAYGGLSSTNSLYICNSRQGSQYSAQPMTADTVKILGIDIYEAGVLKKSFRPAKSQGRPCFFESVAQAYHFSIGSTDGVFGYLD